MLCGLYSQNAKLAEYLKINQYNPLQQQFKEKINNHRN